MLMTRVLYLLFTLMLVAINGAALWVSLSDAHGSGAIVPAALILNAVTWPLALVVSYRIGQVTGVEYFRKIRAKFASGRGPRRHAGAHR